MFYLMFALSYCVIIDVVLCLYSVICLCSLTCWCSASCSLSCWCSLQYFFFKMESIAKWASFFFFFSPQWSHWQLFDAYQSITFLNHHRYYFSIWSNLNHHRYYFSIWSNCNQLILLKAAIKFLSWIICSWMSSFCQAIFIGWIFRKLDIIWLSKALKNDD